MVGKTERHRSVCVDILVSQTYSEGIQEAFRSLHLVKKNHHNFAQFISLFLALTLCGPVLWSCQKPGGELEVSLKTPNI